MNRGVLAGIRSSQWRSYTPVVRAFNYSATTAVDPVLGNGTSYGRYMRTDSALVVAQGIITFGSTSTFGSGEDFWGVTLPATMNRSSGAADMPIGTAMAWQGASANPQLMTPLTPTLMDPALQAGNQSQEDSFLQLFTHWCLAYGTGTVASGPVAATINHGLPFTPTAQDIQIMATATTTSNCGQFYIQSISSTQFLVNTRSSPGASGAAFSWKIRGEPVGPAASAGTGGLLVSSAAPWAWASGHVLSFQAIYEARK